MTKQLRVAVLALSPDGEFQLLPPGQPVPRWATKAIGDSDVWVREDTVASEPETADPSTPGDPDEDPSTPGDPDEDLIGNPDQNPQPPAGNDTLKAWQDYATAKGASPAELEGLTRAQIREKYVG